MSYASPFLNNALPKVFSLTRLSALSVIALGIVAGVAAAFGGWIYAAALVAFVLVGRWPVQLTFGVFAFLVPFDNVSALGSEATGATLTRYVGGIAIAALLVVGLVNRRLVVPGRVALWWSLFTFWGVLSLGWAIDPQIVRERVATVFSIFVLYLAAISFRFTTKELSSVALMAVLGGCTAALLASSEFFNGAYFQGTTRGSVVIGQRTLDPNVFCASLLLPLSLSIGAVVNDRRTMVRVGALLAIVILGLAQMLTMSRGGLLAICAVALVHIYRLRANRRLLLISICFALLLACMPHAFFHRLSLSDRGAGRMDIWIAGMQLLPHYGIIGAGLGNFTIAYDSVAGEAPVFHGFGMAAHSIYLGTAVELGIVGLVLLLFAFRAQLREAHPLCPVPYEAACWGMLVAGLTLDLLSRKSFWLCWVLLAVAVRLQHQTAEEQSI